MKKIDLKTLLNSKKILPHYIKQQTFKNPPPIAVEFHWCTTCNYHCQHCSYSNRRKDFHILPAEIVQNTVNDLIDLGTKSVYFSGGGEPTTYKNWDKYAEQFINNSVDMALITNSILITDKHLDVLKNFNYIAVSIYSSDEEEYKKITGADNFAQEFSLPYRLNSKNGNVVVGARCIINNINYKSIFNTYKTAIENNFDYVIFIPAIDYENNKIDLNDEIKEYVLNSIKENADKINPDNTNLLNLAEKGIQHYKTNAENEFKDYDGCYSVQMRSNVFINYDGNVYLCQPLIGQTEYSIGNLHLNTFKEIWNGNRHKDVIEKLNSKFTNGKCINCRCISYNKIINEYNKTNIIANCPNDNMV